LGVFTTSMSQTLVKENKLWSNTENGTENGYPWRSNYIKFQGDTLINNVAYKKILRCNDSLQTDWFVNGYIREDTLKKVFLFNEQNQTDELIYDFGLEVGDSLTKTNWDGWNIYLGSIEYVTLENSAVPIRQLNFYSDPDTSEGYWLATWYEGIGSTAGILWGLNVIWLVGGEFGLVCYFENDTLKYHHSGFSTCFPAGYRTDISDMKNDNINKEEIYIYPNPTNGDLYIDFSEPKNYSDISIFDIKGQLLRQWENSNQIDISDFENGMYIISVNNKYFKKVIKN
jgi:Secretion system C-terminal sorting domain